MEQKIKLKNKFSYILFCSNHQFSSSRFAYYNHYPATAHSSKRTLSQCEPLDKKRLEVQKGNKK